MRFLLSLSLLFFSALTLIGAPSFDYTLRMPEPHTHYFEVTLQIKDLPQEATELKLPVWAPGSYMVREFAKNVEGFSAEGAKGAKLAWDKTNKNTWRIQTNKADLVTVKYRVYAFELSVRTSFIDASHGYLNGSNIFMWVEGQQKAPYGVLIEPYKGWNQVSTGLPRVGKDKWQYRAPDYDILVDCPIEIGTHKVLQFTSGAGVPHYVALYGEANYEETRLLKDMKTIVDEATKVYGETPLKDYTFIIHNTASGGGGLEHLNSTTLGVSRWGYSEGAYQGFLSLVAHEYFHLWNVKRMRPAALGPFNYSEENYTHLLWLSEGVTSYYDDYITRRAGYLSPEGYLDILASSIGSLENAPGSKVQSAAESSWDAWIKFYRPTENTGNAEVSYYTKGGVLGMLLDLQIREASQNKKNLDDAMHLLYDTYYKKQSRGFTDAEVQQAMEQTAGKSMDEFFKKHIFGTDKIDYNQYLNAAGLRLVNTNEGNQEAFLGAGISLSPVTGKLSVNTVMKGSGAYMGGLNVKDEVVAVNGYRTSTMEEYTRLVQRYKAGDKLQVTVTRDGRLMNLDLTLGTNPNGRYRIQRVENPNAQQQEIYKSWLRIS